MRETPAARERDPSAKVVRIADAAFALFESQGYRETTIDQIAASARVGRRTFFRYFPSKEAVLFDHLLVRRETAIQRLRERPANEPALTSLHAVFRELAEKGYEERLLTQIRSVIAASPQLATEQFWTGSRSFEADLAAVIEDRNDESMSSLEVRALTQMVVAWFTTAGQTYLTEGNRSLLECYEAVVAVCVRASTENSGEWG